MYIEGVEANDDDDEYNNNNNNNNNNKLYCKTRLISILENKQQNKKIDTKQQIYSIWLPSFF